MQIHHEARHPKLPFEPEKLLNLHSAPAPGPFLLSPITAKNTNASRVRKGRGGGGGERGTRGARRG